MKVSGEVKPRTTTETFAEPKGLTDDQGDVRVAPVTVVVCPFLFICIQYHMSEIHYIFALTFILDITRWQDNDGDTAMHWAVMKGALTAVKTLVSHMDTLR